jgi:hypothetical protein
MSKSGNHLPPPPPAAPLTDTSPSRLQLATQWFAVISAFLVVMTPVAYISGRGFHDAWYGYFHLNGDMFPLDTVNMMTMGYEAWSEQGGWMSERLANVIILHTFRMLMAFVGFILFSGVAGLLARLWERRDKQSAPHDLKPALLPGGLFAQVFLNGHLFNVAIAWVMVMWLVSVLTLEASVAMGTYDARAGAYSGFKYEPSVIVKSQDGTMQTFRLMECGPQFCALWGSDHAVMVPVASVLWAESSKP